MSWIDAQALRRGSRVSGAFLTPECRQPRPSPWVKGQLRIITAMSPPSTRRLRLQRRKLWLGATRDGERQPLDATAPLQDGLRLQVGKRSVNLSITHMLS